jgi:hypothetical protein
MSETKSITKPVTTIKNITKIDEPECWLGYIFTMSDESKNITCKIENYHKCCEKWGIHELFSEELSSKENTMNISKHSEDRELTLNDFIGAEYQSVDIGNINTDRETCDYTVTIEVHIHTNKGIINIQFYNIHNSYYEHDVSIMTEHGHKFISI